MPGARRLSALNDLARDGVLAGDHPVPCRVIGNGATDSELSLAENVVRVAMHPADQVVAFTKLGDAGLSVAAIAARFGLSERLVEQRLRLGNAAPELLDAYRADDIDLGLRRQTRQGAARQQCIRPARGRTADRPGPGDAEAPDADREGMRSMNWNRKSALCSTGAATWSSSSRSRKRAGFSPPPSGSPSEGTDICGPS